MKRRVVVTGIGALTPIGNNPQELWESVKAGKCGIDFIKNFDTSNHKVKIAAEIKNFNMDDYIEKRDAKKMDTYCQYAVVSAKQAFADSGLDIEKIGPLFETHPCFPDRVNTEFSRVLDDHTVEMRVWERGAGETLACGTGACAVAVASILNGYVVKDQPVTIKLLGGDLEIFWDQQKNTVFMTGPAEVVFDGEIKL